MPEPYYDPNISSVVVKQTRDWYVSVIPMLFNDRVCLTSVEEYPHGWTAAWCYDKGPAAMLAAMAWDPETQHEPVGYKKVAADSRTR